MRSLQQCNNPPAVPSQQAVASAPLSPPASPAPPAPPASPAPPSPPASPAPSGPSALQAPAELDLGRFDEATRLLLHQRIVAIAFRGDPGDPDTGEPATPPVDPRGAGLAVFPLFGRWFAIWSPPADEAAHRPRWQRDALVHIEADPRAPHGVVLHAL